MSNETNETIADIVADIRAQNQGLPEGSYALSPLVCDLLSLADRIESAHKREMADEKRISEAVVQSLRDKKLEMAGEIAEKDEEIARLRAIVNGLADVVSTARPKFCNGCPAVLCTISGKLCGFVRNADELVAKAREVVQ